MQHIPDPMRHIPEEELHAYLDQALSRSQCVEIEHHLASCPPCRVERDAIAALRDRTTALLLTAAPRRIRPRPYAELSASHLVRASRRGHRLRNTAWAASVAAAVGLGWALNQWSTGATDASDATAARVASVPPVAPVIRAAAPSGRDVQQASTVPAAGRTPGPSTRTRRIVPRAAEPRPLPDEAVAAATLPPPRPAASSFASLTGATSAGEPVLSGVWRTVSWGDSVPPQGEWVPRVDGVPVVQVKVRQASEGGHPITLVTQQLANGEIISTVEGPATDIAELLRQQPGQSASAELQDMSAAPHTTLASQAHPGGAAAPRTLAIFGSAPPDSLKAFMLRVK